MYNRYFMDLAIKQAEEGIEYGDGGPFGCVIVKDGKYIAGAHNMVLATNDCTAHGEIEAIRAACDKLNSHKLDGCELYTTAGPCPMCLGAIQWSGIRKVYYGCNVSDTEKIGFKDKEFYDKDMIDLECQDRDRCLELFKSYEESDAERY